MRPTIQQLKERGYPVQEIDISRDSATANRYNITHVPAFVVLVDGQEFARLVGSTSYTQLERMLQNAGIRPGRQNFLAAANVPVGNTTAATISVPLSSNQPAAGVPPEIVHPGKDTAAVDHLLESTVRLTIQDPQGNSTGTGTIVDSREGEALVLTCGHLFRSSGGQGAITVTLFQATAQGAQVRTTLEGRLVDFDLDRDLGLISFRTQERVQVAPIAPTGTQLNPGSRVTTVGCNHGDNPTAINTQVTSLNRYQGPANVEAAGAPVEGRSGGGMFNHHGQLVGVCFAADPQADEGLFAATSSIHTKLDNLGLAMIYQSPSSGSRIPGQPSTSLARLDTPSAQHSLAPQSMAVRGQQMPAPSDQALFDELKRRRTTSEASPPINRLAPVTTSTPQGQRMASTGSLSPSEQALVDEIVRRGATSEVICIIRPHTPDGKSEVITLQHASSNLVQALTSPPAASPAPQANSPAMATLQSGVDRR
jgi:hypothetical protein